MPPQKFNKLAGKHVLIIGGTSGIGYAVAEGAIESNARVTISSSSSTKVESAIASLKKSYPTATTTGHPCDLSKPTVELDLETLFSKVKDINHIVVTAGDAHTTGPISSITYDSILATGQVRFIAALLMPNVSLKPKPGWSVLGSFAAGMHGMVRGLALDLRPVRVNLVSPGPLDTELWKAKGEEERRRFYEGVAEKMPTGRIAKPDETAESYLWLMKDRNVTGVVAQTDSGLMLV